jgi:hypothetical protein
MSPLSFFADLISPVLDNLNSYLPTFALSESIQHKLITFVLNRTIGRFVDQPGLPPNQVVGDVTDGKIGFARLKLKPEVSGGDIEVTTLIFRPFFVDIEHQRPHSVWYSLGIRFGSYRRFIRSAPLSQPSVRAILHRGRYHPYSISDQGD